MLQSDYLPCDAENMPAYAALLSAKTSLAVPLNTEYLDGPSDRLPRVYPGIRCEGSRLPVPVHIAHVQCQVTAACPSWSGPSAFDRQTALWFTNRTVMLRTAGSWELGDLGYPSGEPTVRLLNLSPCQFSPSSPSFSFSRPRLASSEVLVSFLP